MNLAVLTQSTTPIIGWVASIMGYVINGIYWMLEQIGIPNIGIAIILFTVVAYLIMTPLQINQQKFQKMNAIVMPEIQAIQKKYKGKKDQNSQMAMQQETSAVYAKYGVSPTGSCLPLLIQMPIIFSLFQVINHIPGYISSIGDIFRDLGTKISEVPGYTALVEGFMKDNKVASLRLVMDDGGSVIKDSIIDFLYKLNPDQWTALGEVPAFSGFSDAIADTSTKISRVSEFLGMNITDNPWSVIQRGWADKQWLLLIAAISIPFLAWFTQWINAKLMPQAAPANNNGDQPSTMENSMKSVNTIMPIMSAVMCFTFPIGIGIYWIAGGVIRSVQMLIINKQMEKTDVNDLIKANQEKAKKKRAKKGLPEPRIAQQAQKSARNVDRGAVATKAELEEKVSANRNNSNVKAGSLASKANMVQKLNDKKK